MEFAGAVQLLGVIVATGRGARMGGTPRKMFREGSKFIVIHGAKS